MKVQSLRGFRDFYPEDQARINYLRDKIKAASEVFGYEEFEGPVLESIDLYAAKSSEEIVSEQAFTLEDRGGDKITLRPELTPTLARMVAAKQNELVFPLRWWSFGRFWRYERPQKGRGREFYQWNLDLLGLDSADADVEILEVLIRFLSSLGLTDNDVVFEISDRAFMTDLLAKNSISAELIPVVFKLLDKLPKLNPDEQKQYATTLGLSESQTETILRLVQDTETWQQSDRLVEVMNQLRAKGLEAWIEPNLSIVRGFMYYTGIVFEVSDRERNYRALLGGGRYSNLVENVGGQPVEGIGMGMGDMSISLYLEEKGLLPAYEPSAFICVVGLGTETRAYCDEIMNTLRDNGVRSIFYGTTDNLGKGIKFADRKRIPHAIIIGPDELRDRTITIKDMRGSGSQFTQPWGEWLNHFQEIKTAAESLNTVN